MITIDSLDQLGIALKMARQMAGLSVQTLAEKIGWLPDVLALHEAHNFPGIDISTASQILRACGLSIKITVMK